MNVKRKTNNSLKSGAVMLQYPQKKGYSMSKKGYSMSKKGYSMSKKGYSMSKQKTL